MPTKTKRPIDVLSGDEVAQLMQGCSPTCPTGLRNRALIVVLWRAGLRVSEAINLLPKDFDPRKGTLRVHNGKGGKARTVGIDPQAVAVLGQWMAARALEGISTKAPLLATLKATALTRVYVFKLLKRLAAEANIEKRVHPHGLRHTHATELLTEGANVGVISKQLGHSSIATTSRYLDHIQPQAVIEFTQQRKW